MSTRICHKGSTTNGRSAKCAGRRTAGSWGRATHANRAVANRAVRRHAKLELKNV